MSKRFVCEVSDAKHPELKSLMNEGIKKLNELSDAAELLEKEADKIKQEYSDKIDEYIVKKNLLTKQDLEDQCLHFDGDSNCFFLHDHSKEEQKKDEMPQEMKNIIKAVEENGGVVTEVGISGQSKPTKEDMN